MTKLRRIKQSVPVFWPSCIHVRGRMNWAYIAGLPHSIQTKGQRDGSWAAWSNRHTSWSKKTYALCNYLSNSVALLNLMTNLYSCWRVLIRLLITVIHWSRCLALGHPVASRYPIEKRWAALCFVSIAPVWETSHFAAGLAWRCSGCANIQLVLRYVGLDELQFHYFKSFYMCPTAPTRNRSSSVYNSTENSVMLGNHFPTGG